MLGTPTRRHPHDARCPACAGRHVVLPATLNPAVRRLAALARAAPSPRVELDQVHCTVETKLRRVLFMDEADALDGRRILLLGDDDLTAAALALAAAHGVGTGISEVVVVDVDPRVLEFAEQSLRGARFRARYVLHDFREPLPDWLRGGADTVFTDPPYTSRGAALFLSRAAEAATGDGRRDVFLAFGPRRPAETLEVQRAIATMGFSIQRLVRNFNDYAGAGALGGTSHLYHLATTRDLRPGVEGREDGPLYTGDLRPPVRDYRCRGCGLVRRVGRGQRWPTVEHSKREPCRRCGGSAFVPLPRNAGAAAAR
jgi:predicted methyltransferase